MQNLSYYTIFLDLIGTIVKIDDTETPLNIRFPTEDHSVLPFELQDER